MTMNIYGNHSLIITVGVVILVVGIWILLFETNENVTFYATVVIQNATVVIQNTQKKTEAQLVNHWPMFNLSDVVGKANLYNEVNYTFVNDRFCNSNSAIYLNQGYLQVPAGDHFSRNFTLTVWIFFKSYQNNAGIIDFSNEQKTDTLILSMLYNTPKLFAGSCNENGCLNVTSEKLIKLHNWYHLALAFDGTNAYIYVNGVLTSKGTFYLQNNVERTNNFIGKNSDAIFDELKIYKGAMKEDQILNDYASTRVSNIVNKYCSAKLTYYWPMSNFSEVINGFDLKCELEYENSYTFVPDRHNSPNEAIYLNNGRLRIPAGVYFIDSHFTITAWVYFKEYKSNSRIVEFSNGNKFGTVIDGIIVYFYYGNKPELRIANSDYYCPDDRCSLNYSYFTIDYVIELNKWYHIAYALKRHSFKYSRMAKANFYIDGELKKIDGNSHTKKDNSSYLSTWLFDPADEYCLVATPTKERVQNYIGGSSFSHEPNANAIFDDIKIFDGALDSNDVMSEFLNS